MAGHYDFSSVRCLIVDNSSNMRRVTITALKALGVERTREAADGARGLEELSTFPADLVIVEWAMRPMDGIEFARVIRNTRQSPNPYLPIIMLTSYTDPQQIIDARDAGVNEVLAKPISIRALGQHLVEIVERPRPFVKCGTYFGPSRRRELDPSNYAGPDRRAGEGAAP